MKMVYAESESFPRHEQYGLTSQIRRASVGVLSDIAEGEGRLTDGERLNMLSAARGSLFEVEAQALGAHELRYLTDDQLKKIERLIRRVGKALLGFIRHVDHNKTRRRIPPEPPQPRNPATP